MCPSPVIRGRIPRGSRLLGLRVTRPRPSRRRTWAANRLGDTPNVCASAQMRCAWRSGLVSRSNSSTSRSVTPCAPRKRMSSAAIELDEPFRNCCQHCRSIPPPPGSTATDWISGDWSTAPDPSKPRHRHTGGNAGTADFRAGLPGHQARSATRRRAGLRWSARYPGPQHRNCRFELLGSTGNSRCRPVSRGESTSSRTSGDQSRHHRRRLL